MRGASQSWPCSQPLLTERSWQCYASFTMTKRLLTLMLLFVGATGCHRTQGDSQQDTQASAELAAQTVSRMDWLVSTMTSLPTAMCQADQYFRQCFGVSEDKCMEVMRLATRSCLDEHEAELPIVFVLPRDGARWGTVVGSCAGSGYEVTLKGRRRNDLKRCNDLQTWVAASSQP